MTGPEMDDEHPWQLGFARHDLRLSPSMRRALRTLALGEAAAARDRATVTALARRNLCEADGHLTPFGRAVAVELLPLHHQCRLLDLPLEVRDLDWSGRPEDAAAAVLGADEPWAFADEGRTLHALIHALVLPRLRKVALEAWRGNEGRVRSYFYGSFAAYHDLKDAEPALTQMMLGDVASLNAGEFIEAWATLRRWNVGMLTDHPASRVPRWKAAAMLERIGRRTLCGVLAREMLDRSVAGSGWPDLTLPAAGGGGGVRLVEVKTTDRLHFSQIVTMPAVRDVPGVSVGVLRLRRQKRVN